MIRFLCALIALLALSQRMPAQDLKASDPTATVAVWVDAMGKAKRVEIRKSCGRASCDAAAMAAAMAREFAPGMDAAAQQKPKLLMIGTEVRELPQ